MASVPLASDRARAPNSRARLVALVLLGLSLAACTEQRDVTVAGKTVFRGMAVEDVQLQAFSLGGRELDTVATGRSGYHGSFSLRLPPGDYRLEGRGSLPQQNRGTLQLGGQVTVNVPSNVRRVDRVVIPLQPAPPKALKPGLP